MVSDKLRAGWFTSSNWMWSSRPRAFMTRRKQGWQPGYERCMSHFDAKFCYQILPVMLKNGKVLHRGRLQRQKRLQIIKQGFIDVIKKYFEGRTEYTQMIIDATTHLIQKCSNLDAFVLLRQSGCTSGQAWSLLWWKVPKHWKIDNEPLKRHLELFDFGLLQLEIGRIPLCLTI